MSKETVLQILNETLIDALEKDVPKEGTKSRVIQDNTTQRNTLA